MDLKPKISHALLKHFYAGKRQAFVLAAQDIEVAQRGRLDGILRALAKTEKWSSLSAKTSYEEFSRQVPLREYSDFASEIEQQRDTGRALLSTHVTRWEPTSGSTEHRKWIPYSPSHLDDMNAAASVWLGDLYQNFSGLSGGRHYWSLSWLPESLRQITSANDEELFPSYQRWLLKNTMLMPAAVSTLPLAKQSWQATALLLLAEENLRFVFVWSPTFFLQILDTIEERWSEFCELLELGSWGDDDALIRRTLGPAPKRNLAGIESGNWKKVWPRLQLLSAWDSSSSEKWANKLQRRLPGVEFQGKGLWATEGVVTIPFEDRKPLAFQSHFYEFIDLETDEVLPSWLVKKDKTYQPVLSCSNGLLRYKLADRLLCTGYFETVPCFEFLGRIHSVDLVGEKISVDFVKKIFEPLRDHEPICLLALHQPRPRYVLVCGQPGEVDIEAKLSAQHHYRLARELGQLDAAEVVFSKNPAGYLSRLRPGSNEGQLKMDLLIEIPGDVREITP
ncbi:GH3 auxin-responsive promoter family protein [soil metagenome]